MDILLYIVVGIICFAAGKSSSPAIKVTDPDITDKERKDYQYQKTLNQTLLSEVQQYRALETKLRGELWETKQTLKKSQQKN